MTVVNTLFNYKTRSSTGVNVLDGIYDLLHGSDVIVKAGKQHNF